MVWTTFNWIVFGAIVSVALFLDLFVFHRKNRESSFAESLVFTLFWCSLALSFNGLVYYWAGLEKATEFLTGYLIEWSLSIDNVFVFAVVFSYFKLPKQNQYRVLFWGILGAIIMRFIFIFVGTEMIKRFDWIMSVFGVFLIYSGIRLGFQKTEEVDPEAGIVLRLCRRFLPLSKAQDNDHFIVKEDGKWRFTPLFVVLLVIETSDVIFAIDSVPAIFGITLDPFILFTSNIFAILGLRALYFLISKLMDKLRFLSFGLCAILIFVGGKMIIEYWFPRTDGGHWVSPEASLLTIVSILFSTGIVSVVASRREKQ